MTAIFAQTALLPTGWRTAVRVEFGPDGRVDGVEHPSAPRPGDVALARRALLPAPANVHSHAHQRAMAGLGERRGCGRGRDDFWSWRRTMYGLLARLGPAHLEAIAALVYKEMLEAGYASVGEFHYLHHAPDGGAYAAPAEMSARIVAAARLSGIGLTLLPVLYAYGGGDRRPVAAEQRRFRNDPDGFARLVEGARPLLAPLGADARLGVALHSLRAVDPEMVARVVEDHGDGPIHIHVAEQPAEVEQIEAALGARPVAWLLDNAPVDARWCLVHATHMTPAETTGLARSGAVAGLCPITEANLGDGLFDAARYRRAGGRVGFGSDSNVRISLAEELRLFEYGQRLRDRARCVLADDGCSTGQALFEAAVDGGARALGRAPGGIAPGAWADLVAVDRDALPLAACPTEQLLDGWLFAGADAGVVTDVWAAGRHVVRDGRHVRADEIERRYRTAVAELRAGTTC